MTANYQDRIQRVLTYIDENPDGDLSLDQLADVAAMSRFHWHRVFHAMVGETCAQTVRRVRLNKAANLLLSTQMPVTEIANAVGYPTVASFGRAFRAAFRTTPAMFRRRSFSVQIPSPDHKRGNNMYNIEVRQAPARRLVGTHHTGAYTEIPTAFGALSGVLAAANAWPNVRGMAGVYFDDPDVVEESKLRSFAAAVFADDAELPSGADEIHLTGGKTAVLTFKGPYDGFKSAYDYFFGEWIPQSGQELRDEPAYEIYLNDPTNTPPEELLTEICVSLV